MSPRLLARLIYMPDGCLIFRGATDRGYGRWHGLPGNKVHRVHKLVYEELMGKVPDGLDLDHLCRNRACANPMHLEPVTRKVNINRGWDARGRGQGGPTLADEVNAGLHNEPHP